MGKQIQSILESGFDGITIDVECTISKGLPNIIIVGFANKAVDEAKERIRSAFTSSQLLLPRQRITINLAPADIPKDTTGFDLAIATAILQTSQIIPVTPDKSIVVGELGLDGNVRPVRGIIGKLLAGKKLGFKTFYIPAGNTSQASLVSDIDIVPVTNLRELYLHFAGQTIISSLKEPPILKLSNLNQLDFSDVVGQSQAKRALEIAAAGGHNVLLSGPPGTGKSMLAKAFPSILPPMSTNEILEVTHLHSLASKDYERLITIRPFRAPHHSSSDTAIIGGGKNPRPGEISLSHHGVLFMDEFPEFNRPTIEALRQPLEDQVVTISRAKDTLQFPANFILIATANPCPCGNYGTPKECSCLPHHIMQYKRKLSGPILDRIDIHVNVENVSHNRLLGDESLQVSSSNSIRAKVQLARARQVKRFKNGQINSGMSNRDIKQYSLLTPDAKLILDKAAEKLELSARSYMRCIKVARTIADLENSDAITGSAIAESLQYRPQNTL